MNLKTVLPRMFALMAIVMPAPALVMAYDIGGTDPESATDGTRQQTMLKV